MNTVGKVAVWAVGVTLAVAAGYAAFTYYQDVLKNRLSDEDDDAED